MLLMYPKDYLTAKAGWVPDLTDIEDSRKFQWASRIPKKDDEMIVEVRRFFDMNDLGAPLQDKLTELEEEQAARGIKSAGQS